MILVDTNVLLDLFTDDKVWRSWSEQALREALLNDAAALGRRRLLALIEEFVKWENIVECARMEVPASQYASAPIAGAGTPSASCGNHAQVIRAYNPLCDGLLETSVKGKLWCALRPPI